jgi:hypothetical protein
VGECKKRKIEKFFGFFNSPPKEEKVKNKPEEKQAHISAKKVKPDKEHAMKKVKDFDRGHLPSDAMRQFREECYADFRANGRCHAADSAARIHVSRCKVNQLASK